MTPTAHLSEADLERLEREFSEAEADYLAEQRKLRFQQKPLVSEGLARLLVLLSAAGAVLLGLLWEFGPGLWRRL